MTKQNVKKPTTKKPKKVKSTVDHGQWLSKLNAFLTAHHYKLCGVLFALTLLISIVYFTQGNNSPITSFYKWPNSDMSFFDLWAKKIAAGDWWGKEALHPYHDWHDDLADEYFKQFPEEKTKYIPAAADSTQTDLGKRAFINDLYNGKVYHQEPLYTYMLAITYSIFGEDHKWVFFWQFLLGALTIVLIYLIGKNLFNPLSGLIAALLITFAGSVAFFTMVLLRTTLTNFFTVLLLYLLIKVAESPTWKRYLAFGVASGLAILSQSYIILFIIPALVWLILKQRRQSSVWLKNIGVFAGAFLLVLLPLFIRNMKVGAPVASVASHGTITFIPNNNATSQPMESFFINMASLAKISHDSKGHLIPAAFASLSTFDSFGAFWKVYWQKFSGMFMWYELPNNVNFYLHREIAPVLKLLPVSYYIIAPLGLAGLILGLWRHRKVMFPIVLMILVCMAPLIIAGNMARYRSPLVVMFGITAGFFLVELLTLFIHRNFKTAFISIGIAIIAFLFTSNVGMKQTFVYLPSDIDSFYRYHYLPQLMENERTSNLEGFHAATSEMIEDIPDYYLEVPLSKPIVRSNESETSKQVSFMLESHSNVLKAMKREREAVFYDDRIKILRARAEDFERRINK